MDTAAPALPKITTAFEWANAELDLMRSMASKPAGDEQPFRAPGD